ncbi:response regulator transcription factor [Anaeromyxobacter dehalogenans]|uniref:Response regulator receiver domain protein (CheY-like) n=1 Tax=Anaeromyxobacter dehalogenans (strain 2CP-C) TaxID=290397 RepID=Q2IGF1_ANADE|nr:response regulator [Anaeromyxobacter dehalogenans]ABC83655.1 response regulator receiver domain protein (CheY-like) [Anaeromyxobacter dehalogenans 2CP-C]
MEDHRETAQPKVLLVEDDDDLRVAMAGCLAGAGFDVTLVATGADAVRAALRDHPQVMVIDVMLPDSGGLGVAEALHRYPELEQVPVLFTTGLAAPAVKALLAPAPVLFKPFGRRQLVSAVRSAVQRRPPASQAPAAAQ